MASTGFPSTSGSNAISLDVALQEAMSVAAQVKQAAQTLANNATGTLGADKIVWWPVYLSTQNSLLSSYAAVPGIAAYAQTQLGNATLNIATAYAAMQSALQATITWITTNFPADTNGNLLYTQYGSGGSVLTYTQFSASELTGLVTVLNALIATIN